MATRRSFFLLSRCCSKNSISSSSSTTTTTTATTRSSMLSSMVPISSSSSPPSLPQQHQLVSCSHLQPHHQSPLQGNNVLVKNNTELYQKHQASGGGTFGSPPAGAAPGVEKLFQCSSCKKAFRLVNALNHHIKIKHGGDAKVIVVGPDGKPIPGAQLDEAPGAGAGGEKVARKLEQVPGIKPPEPRPGAPGTGTPTATPTTPEEPKVKVSDATAKPADGETVKGEEGAGAGAGATSSSPEEQKAPVDEDIDKKLFICTICQKGFRLEAALQHHYQAKHGMEMPTAAKQAAASGAPAATITTTDATSGGMGGVGLDGSTGGIGSGGGGGGGSFGGAGIQYVHPSDAEAPQPPNYHFDVAPNAPEESEIAIHHRCVNHMMLIGVVQDIQQGFVFEDPCIQFILATEFDSPAPGEPDKDFHTVRLFQANTGPLDLTKRPPPLTAQPVSSSAEAKKEDKGDNDDDDDDDDDEPKAKKATSEEASTTTPTPEVVTPEVRTAVSGQCIGYGSGFPSFLERMKSQLHQGDKVLVNGRLRMIPQFEQQTNKYYHFPVVQVVEGAGEVVVLDAAQVQATATTTASVATPSEETTTTASGDSAAAAATTATATEGGGDAHPTDADSSANAAA